MSSQLERAVARRRTFAIISHPDAGKTTLTEKLLLAGGAIQAAGVVKARGEQRRTRSDWMKVERERGISVSASVMTFERGGCTFNLLDTPGHEDFSEDTYRTLTAVDSAVMVLDAAKGIEAQTLKLFEVCRVRDVPIVTFINKMDREGRDPLELLDEIEQTLQLEVTPATWPLGGGQRFRGTYSLEAHTFARFDRNHRSGPVEVLELSGPDDPDLAAALGDDAARRLAEEVAMATELCPPFDRQTFLEGNQTPVFFGSALTSFGVEDLLGGIAREAPPPRPQRTAQRTVEPHEEAVSGFVFKIQANMDPKHRDRIAFVRLCSGRFERGARLKIPRTGKTINVHNPVLFMARERELAEEAFPGDIIGVPNHGNLVIGDALTEGEDLHFLDIPSFAPELLRKVRAVDPMRSKHLGRALQQLAEEGAAQTFKTRLGGEWIVGVAGALQFEVLAERIGTEYDLEAEYASTTLTMARWVAADDERTLRRFVDANEAKIAEDHTGAPVFMAASTYYLDRAREEWPQVRFLKTKEQTAMVKGQGVGA
ncbi:MAG: peptide chain release factor 3 [Acidobacteria bacterium]|nr:MAG: peptide chain release factor 3 [Acidobacteriota bacterium]REK00143.1 MAG: peptide chain release factor 3 [Acidobacteriota bacterium]